MQQNIIFITSALKILAPLLDNEIKYPKQCYTLRRLLVKQIQLDLMENQKHELYNRSLGKILYQDLLQKIASNSKEYLVFAETVEQAHLYLTQDIKSSISSDGKEHKADSLKTQFKKIFFDGIPDKSILNFKIYITAFDEKRKINDAKAFSNYLFDVMQLKTALVKLFKTTLSPKKSSMNKELKYDEIYSDIYELEKEIYDFKIDLAIETEVSCQLAVLKEYVNTLTMESERPSDKSMQLAQELNRFLDNVIKNGIITYDPYFYNLTEIDQRHLLTEAIEWQLMLLQFSLGFDELRNSLNSGEKLEAQITLSFLENCFLIPDDFKNDLRYELKKGKSSYLSSKLEKYLPEDLYISQRAILLLYNIRPSFQPYVAPLFSLDIYKKSYISQAKGVSFLNNMTTFEQEAKQERVLEELKKEHEEIISQITTYSEVISNIKSKLNPEAGGLLSQNEKELASHHQNLLELNEIEQRLHQQIKEKEIDLATAKKLKEQRDKTLAVMY